MSNIYAGTSAFFANRAGNHNWLDNNNRPFLSVITTKPSGKKRYDDLFLNKHKDIKVIVANGQVAITFPVDTKQPIFRVLHKKEK